MVLLRDVPGGETFIESLADQVRDLSLAFAGEDNTRVAARLERLRVRLVDQLTPELGAKTATEIANAFIAAVRGRRAGIEAARCGTQQ